MLEQLLLEVGLKDGIFVGLFIWLLIYVMKTTKEREVESISRENKLLSFLDDMKYEFGKLVGSYEKLQKDVAEIREDMNEARKQGGNKRDL